ncbi:subtilisin-like protease SBT5.4 [Mercurialis annua]|uniref:subtilisin-like protease SBT5.4 n=1 Tax=Mercurialis annua TaxID=3986 RepID=UPI00215EF07E|nr:subtilisin-like protease SBT5.4 [Mercurialis annua]
MLNKQIRLAIISPLVFSTLLSFFLSIPSNYAAPQAPQSYIVYLGDQSPPTGEARDVFSDEKVSQSHFDMVSSLIQTDSAKPEGKILYSYTKSMDGFAAVLDDSQVQMLKNQPNVRAVFPNKRYELHTTHSWDYLQLADGGVAAPASLWNTAKYGQDIIIANLDTGVWPESASFKDDGMGPVPARWRGGCSAESGIRCNKKLIGAKVFSKGAEAAGLVINKAIHSARDYQGHGSHTLSTAGGSFVPGANIFGYGNGTAKGGAPKARVASYKICWSGGCYGADILAALDAAIKDGVDVLSMSIGSGVSDLFQDATSIGSFNAMKKGIPVVASAGNEGPGPETINNVCPWLFTTGASTMDRSFSNFLVLGDQKHINGSSLSSSGLPAGKVYPLINAADAKSANAVVQDAILCKNGSLDKAKVAGKLIVCLRGDSGRLEKGMVVAGLGAAGMVLANDPISGSDLFSDPHFLPAIHVTYADGQAIYEYIKATKNPTASLFPVTSALGVKPSPQMAAFSSRGPNPLFPGLLKPDITAPGVNILAAFSGAASPSELDIDKRRIPYNVLSGTSMSCPHVAGIVGLIKSIHPDWSPAAIKSAIMTTSKTQASDGKEILDADGKFATPFSYGAGHVQPNIATDPGLVYDLTPSDYLNSLCAIGYNASIIKGFAGFPYVCPPNYTLNDFNYPSFAVPDLAGPVVATRKLKNVGTPGTYTATVVAPAEVSVVVEPTKLTFTKIGQELAFKVTFKPTGTGAPKDYVFGQLKWSDGKHTVQSPLVMKHA